MEKYLTPEIVGRNDELTLLHKTLAEVQDGAGNCVLISGEAGIGKSRLMREIKELSGKIGFTTMTGRCFEQDISLPYAPLIDMLRSFLVMDPALKMSRFPETLAEKIANFLPEIKIEMQSNKPGGLSNPEEEKRKLFETLANFIVIGSEKKPVIITIEDIHWSDASSLEFLLFLVRRIALYPVMLLLSYRPDESNDILNVFLSGLDREPVVQSVKLKPFSLNEVEQMLKVIISQTDPLSVEFLTVVYNLTDGNPFFTEEIFTSLISSGDIYHTKEGWRRKNLSQINIPDNIQRLIEWRIKPLSLPAIHLLELAAVSGRSFDLTVLKSLTGKSDVELLDMIKELMKAHLVVEENADQFAFRHALTREALYSRLLGKERQILHGEMAVAIENIYSDTIELHVEALSYHYFEAADWKKAYEYAQRAGEKAIAKNAPHAAIDHLTRAISAGERINTSNGLTSLYRLRGMAYDTLGIFEKARQDFESALNAGKAEQNDHDVWQSYLDLSLLWASRDYKMTGLYCQKALDLANSMDDQATISHSLNQLGNWLMNDGKPFEAIQYHLEAKEIFEKLNDQSGIATTLDLLAMTSNMCGDVEGTLAYYGQAIPILRAMNDRQTLSSCLANMSLYTLNQDDAEEAVQLAQNIDWRSGEAYGLVSFSWTLFNACLYDKALEIGAQSLKIARSIEHPQWIASSLIFSGLYYLELLELDKAQKSLEEGLTLAKEVGSSFFIWMGSGNLASVYIKKGQLEKAEALISEAPRNWIPPLYRVRLAEIELALALGDGSGMLTFLEDIKKYLIQPDKAIGVIPLALGPAMNLLSEALVLEKRFDEAEQELREVEKLYIKHGITNGLWKIFLTLGKVYQVTEQAVKPEEALNHCREQIEIQSAAIEDATLRENFLAKATVLIPTTRPLTALQTAAQTYGHLTRRERQIAAALTQGLSNQEIADKFVISIKTVEAHVSHILSKLGFSTRTQVAAWAVEKGLASAPKDLDSLLLK